MWNLTWPSQCTLFHFRMYCNLAFAAEIKIFHNQPNLSWSDPKKSLKIMIAQVGPLILTLDDGWWAKGYLYKKHLLLTALGHTPTEEHDRGQAP